MNTDTNKIETWAVVEIMGHQQLAGFARTEAFGSTVMLRVDVPDLPERERDRYGTKEILPEEPGWTSYVGMGSIYRLTPCTEEFARQAADRMRKLPPRGLASPALPAPAEQNDDTVLGPVCPECGCFECECEVEDSL